MKENNKDCKSKHKTIIIKKVVKKEYDHIMKLIEVNRLID